MAPRRSSRNPAASNKRKTVTTGPLQGMVFCLSGKLSKAQTAISTEIEAAGGKVESTVSGNVTHVLSNTDNGKKVSQAKAQNIGVVDEDWLAAKLGIDNGESPTKKKAKVVTPTTTQKSPPVVAAKTPTTKTAPSAARVASSEVAAATLAGCVDPAAPAHLRQGTLYGEYDAMLNQTNLQHNNNKFIRVQLIQTSSGITLHKRWGRVGESGSQQQIGPMGSDKAIKEFSKYFRSKTSNNWKDRDNFSPCHGKYTLIHMEADTSAAEAQKASSVITAAAAKIKSEALPPSSLGKSIQSFVNLIFDEDMFKSAMSELDIDPAKLPLGALSKTQVQKGRGVLVRLQAALSAGRRSPAQIQMLSGEFYTVIPHDFGRRCPPAINTMDALQKKFEMLNTLEDIETAQSTLKQAQEGDGNTKKHPTDVNYDALKIDLEEVTAKNAPEEWSIIKQYTDVTAGSYYSKRMKLQHVFRASRHGEDAIFKAHDDLENRRLLWHGTNVAVVAAILKSGIRIMPHSGGRVGKGIYLADMHEKSWGYTRGTSGRKIMFLVEAALGSEHSITMDDSSLTKPPKGHHSIVARGTRLPDPAADAVLTIDGHKVTVPQGKPTAGAGRSSFHHNEYLLYQESQHRIRYVLEFRD